jgi:hypothetical protein
MTALAVNEVDPIVYWIDRADTVTSVNEMWAQFATANGRPELAGSATGSSLWAHVTGDDVTLLWHGVLERVRAGNTISIPYRCDSPSERRFLNMLLRPHQDGTVEFISETRRVEARPYMALLEPIRDDETGELIRSCSWCRRFFVDGWVEIEEAISRLDLLDGETRQVTHGMCSDCERDVRLSAGLT